MLAKAFLHRLIKLACLVLARWPSISMSDIGYDRRNVKGMCSQCSHIDMIIEIGLIKWLRLKINNVMTMHK